MQSKGFSFKGQRIFIGIDVHLKTWSVAILTSTGTVEKFSQESEALILHNHLCKVYPDGMYQSVYESGFCGFSVHFSLMELGIENIVVNAADVPTSQKECVNKNDPVDAMKLAKALKAGLLHPIYVPEIKTLGDRELIRTRSVIVQDISRIKSRIKHFLHRNGIIYPARFSNPNTHWSRLFFTWMEEEATVFLADAKESLLQHICIIKLLRAQLLDITRKIREMSRTDAYATNMKLLCSIPGIGFHTSISFLIEIEDINRFGNEREFASFIGIVPTCHSSGEKENVGEMTFRGNKHMQQKLIEASWVAISKDRALAACYMKYRTRMDKNKAIIRIARKLSNRIMTILKKQEKYVNDKNVQ